STGGGRRTCRARSSCPLPHSRSTSGTRSGAGTAGARTHAIHRRRSTSNSMPVIPSRRRRPAPRLGPRRGGAGDAGGLPIGRQSSARYETVPVSLETLLPLPATEASARAPCMHRQARDQGRCPMPSGTVQVRLGSGGGAARTVTLVLPLGVAQDLLFAL